MPEEVIWQMGNVVRDTLDWVKDSGYPGPGFTLLYPTLKEGVSFAASIMPTVDFIAAFWASGFFSNYAE